MSGPRAPRDPRPVTGLEFLVIDGDNLLHRVRGSRDDAGVHWLVPRLRGWRPAQVRVLLMLDGTSDPGLAPRQPVAPGITLQHSGRMDADTAIVELVRARPYAERARTVVVTDDRQLADRIRHAGALVRRLDWLVDQLGRPDVPSPPRAPVRIGGGRPPKAPDATTPVVRDPDGSTAAPWRPGRGATTKRGNPRRAPRGPRA